MDGCPFCVDWFLKMGKRIVCLRADAGPEIGFGHFMRCVALASMLQEDFECRFFTVEPALLQERAAVSVGGLYPLGRDHHYKEFLSCLRGDEIVVLDNYYFSTEYQKAVRAKGCPLVCIDDMHDKHYVADVVVNHGCEDACLFSVESYTRLCLGVSWALLRRPFLEVLDSGWHRDRQGKSAVVCVGGSDPYSLVAKYLVAIKENHLAFDRIRVIAGIKTHIPEGIPEVEILPQGLTAREVCSVLQEADMGFFSASTVCLEALSVGLPSVVGYYIDNQRNFYRYVTSLGMVYGVGDLLQTDAIDLGGLSGFMPKFDNLDMRGIQARYVELFKSL